MFYCSDCINVDLFRVKVKNITMIISEDFKNNVEYDPRKIFLFKF